VLDADFALTATAEGMSMDDGPSFPIKQDKTSRVGKMASRGLLAQGFYRP
jgi:hypothetical protein